MNRDMIWEYEYIKPNKVRVLVYYLENGEQKFAGLLVFSEERFEYLESVYCANFEFKQISAPKAE